MKPEPLPNMRPHILILMSRLLVVGETAKGDENNGLDYTYWNSKILLVYSSCHRLENS